MLIGLPDEFAAGSVLEGTGWNTLSRLGIQFNVIFSDALHSPAGVESEFMQIQERALLDTAAPFAMMWDDCETQLQQPFRKICSQFSMDCKVPMLPAWLGLQEGLHPTCCAFSGNVLLPSYIPMQSSQWSIF